MPKLPRSYRVHIDASNLSAGGGVQVAASFIDELCKLSRDESVVERHPWINHAVVSATRTVLDNTYSLDGAEFTVYEHTSGWMSTSAWASRHQAFDVTFNLFGPMYGWRDAKRTISGFADLTSIETGVLSAVGAPGLPTRVKQVLRRHASRRSFMAADHLIVEAPHVAKSLITHWHVPPHRITVVPNTVNSTIRSNSDCMPDTPRDRDYALWCYVTRAYPHKNLRLLGYVGEILSSQQVQAKFLLTLTKREWESQHPLVQKHSLNLGPVSVHELSGVYAQCIGAVFPSLLESFSVTPLEAMAMGRPLVASDRAFVRDVCADAAAYADPLNPHAWANTIAKLTRNGAARDRMITRGRQIADTWPTARDRALQYLQIIEDQLSHI